MPAHTDLLSQATQNLVYSSSESVNGRPILHILDSFFSEKVMVPGFSN